jgi:hypothetical protein
MVLHLLLFFLCCLLHVSIGFYYPSAISRIYDRRVKLTVINQEKPRSYSTNSDRNSRSGANSYRRNDQGAAYRSVSSDTRYSNSNRPNSGQKNMRYDQSSAVSSERKRNDFPQRLSDSRVQDGPNGSYQRDSSPRPSFPREQRSDFNNIPSFPSTRESSYNNHKDSTSPDRRTSFTSSAPGRRSFPRSQSTNSDKRPFYPPSYRDEGNANRSPSSSTGHPSSVSNVGQVTKQETSDSGSHDTRRPSFPRAQQADYKREYSTSGHGEQTSFDDGRSFPRSQSAHIAQKPSYTPRNLEGGISTRHRPASTGYPSSESNTGRSYPEAQPEKQSYQSFPRTSQSNFNNRPSTPVRTGGDTYRNQRSSEGRRSSSTTGRTTFHESSQSQQGSKLSTSYPLQLVPQSESHLVPSESQISDDHDTPLSDSPQISSHSSFSSQQSLPDDMADKHHFYSKKSFEEIGCNEKMIKTLQTMDIYKPSRIQALAFPNVYQGKTCIIGDQTGSGKTFAYLLPVIQRLDELYQNRTLFKPQGRAPYIIIITPTTELAK